MSGTAGFLYPVYLQSILVFDLAFMLRACLAMI